MSFSDEERYPGDVTTLQVRADADSLCSVAVVDKSVHVLGGNDNVDLSKVTNTSHHVFRLLFPNTIIH